MSEHDARKESVIAKRGKMPPGIAKKLSEAGYGLARDLRAATDKELLTVQGVGQGTLKKIRDWVGQ